MEKSKVNCRKRSMIENNTVYRPILPIYSEDIGSGVISIVNKKDSENHIDCSFCIDYRNAGD